MPVVFFQSGVACDLPPKNSEGEPLTDTNAWILNKIFFERLTTKLRYLVDHGQLELSTEALSLKATALALEPMSSAEEDDNDDDNPIIAEALIIARELIIRSLAKDGIEPPKNIDTHARALVDGAPALKEQAKKRLEIKHQAALEALQNLGATP